MFDKRGWTALVVGLVLLGWAVSEALLALGPISPSPGAAVTSPIDQVRVKLRGIPLVARARVDGEPIPVEVRWRQAEAVLHPGSLQEGRHSFELELRGALRTVSQAWELTVDDTPPVLDLEIPEIVPGASLTASGHTEPRTTVEIGGRELSAGTDGSFAAPVDLTPGLNELAFTARDPAGNTQARLVKVYCDLEAPVVRISRPRDGAVVSKGAPGVSVESQDPGGLTRVRWRVDRGGWFEAPLEQGGPEQKHSWELPEQTEGLHTVEVEATDRVGRASTRQTTFTVDSSEKFGERELSLGAQGRDVRDLQRRLADLKVIPAEGVQGFFGDSTGRALEAFQRSHGLEPTGIADRATLVALGPRVFVNLARFSLVLDRPGSPLRRFSIAHGSSAYPTPSGQYRVVEKVMNPTWLPPDSPWAAGARPVPPGPGNPLGTRWIGLDRGGVGIHGTSAPSSIGSRASHGCIRMHISDVERLYAMVSVGTPVFIFSGYESSELLHKYW